MRGLSALKKDVSLVDYAQRNGYRIDEKESKRHSDRNQVLRMGPEKTGDKLCVSRQGNGDWTYYSFRDERDKGSIVDFVQHRSPRGTTSAQAIEVLRRDGDLSDVPKYVPDPRREKNEAMRKQAAARTLQDVRRADYHPYLAERNIDQATASSPRFAGKWGVGRLTYVKDEQFRQGPTNLAFAYRTDKGVEGMEMRAKDFKHLTTTGAKGLWVSRCYSNDRTMVLTEGPLDAMSYHRQHRDPHTRYFSTGGSVGEGQLKLLRQAMRKMPQGSRVVAAFDNDDGGRHLTEQCRRLAKDAGLEFRDHTPKHAKDWNHALELQLTQERSRARSRRQEK